MYRDVMVDIETTGTAPDRAAIIQIAAVKFDLENRTICDEDMFDRCLLMPPTRAWDEGTRSWWGQQKRSVLDGIFRRMEDPKTVLKDFSDWALPVNCFRFWGKPTHFDFTFLASYFRDYEVMNPFNFREANDMNTFIRSLYFPAPVPELDLDFKGDKHNALHDTLNQIGFLFAHLDRARGEVLT